MKRYLQRKPNPIRLEKKSFLEHLNELKLRFFIWFLILLVFSVVGYFHYSTILYFLTKPLGKPLYYTTPVGGFEIVFNISLFFGFLLSLPVLLYEIIVFVRPTISKEPLISLFLMLVSSIVLALTGIAVCYYLVLPPSLKFLGEFGGSELSALISTNDYFSFITKYLISFALIFQLPLVMIMINKISPLNIKKLFMNFRYIILVTFIISAILTPTPDLINQAIMATPILSLYLLSVAIVWWITPQKKHLKSIC